MPDASVTFVIPHKGREEFLRMTLQSIARQKSTVPFDVTVVSQNQRLSSATIDVLDSRILNVLYEDPSETISTLRNRGAQTSESTHLAFLDADIELSQNWLQALFNLLKEMPEAALVSAAQRHTINATELEKIRTTLSNAHVDSPAAFLPGRNLLLKRSVFEDVGGFPEKLITCEDYWFTASAGELGLLWYSSEASYVHLGEDKHLPDLFSKEVWRGQSNLQSLRGRRVPKSEWPSFFVPPGICICFGLAVVMLMAAQPALAGLFVSAALLPLGAYVIRLYLLGKSSLRFSSVVAFYLVYFPARALGTLLGLFRSLGSKLHDQ